VSRACIEADRSPTASTSASSARPSAIEQVGAPAMTFRAAVWAKRGGDQFQAVLRAAKSLRADLLLTSVLCQGALLAAEVLDLPVVVLGLAAHLWTYQAGAEEEPEEPVCRRWRENNMLRLYEETRELAGLAPRHEAWPLRPLLGSGLLLRGHPALEYPGGVLPPGVHHVGPCLWEPPTRPGELADITAALDAVGKPVVYTHLGRTFGGEGMWPRLNAAFTDGPFQAVVELGRTKDPLPAAGADLLVVRKRLMGPLIDRSEMVLTNATSAPVLMGLRRGRPLLVAPAGAEQPLLAEACIRAGVAVRFPQDLKTDGAQALSAAHADPVLRSRAEKLGADLALLDQSERAADLVEAAAHKSLFEPMA
jgi:UDP:flavonoid glycosyltransferase YjiC (YdhE family)